VLRLRRPAPGALQGMLAKARAEAPTYAEVGATRHETMPAGYRHDRYEAPLGHGPVVYDSSIRALRIWQAQRGAGLGVVPPDAWVEDGETVLLLIRVGVLNAVAPCRVVYVTEEARRFSFAYGTLPGHPEQGEVAFAIALDADESVRFEVVSFSRTIDRLARLGTPVTRFLQKRVTGRYLAALQEAVR
jgi:uncharacterized protein (UPF0548 family)